MDELADGTLRLLSRVLGLELREEATGLRFYDPATRSYLLSSEEVEKHWQRAEQDSQLEAAARRAAEARLHDEAATRRQTEARLHDESVARRRAEARVVELEALLRQPDEDGSTNR